MRIFNGTQHSIHFYSIDNCTSIEGGRKLILGEGAMPYLVVPPGVNLNCEKENLASPSLNSPIPLTGAVVFTSYDALPEGYDLYIVSNLYRSAVASLGGDTSKLATVSGTVYKGIPGEYKPCGCTELAVG